jgi:hypothetical protein
MEVIIQKPPINPFKKSFQFILADHRKIISVIVSLCVPVIMNLWKLLPDDIVVEFYPSVHVLAWTLSIHFISVLICIAWWFSINSKDYVLQFFSLGLMAYCAFLTYCTLPFTVSTPFWQDLTASTLIFIFLTLSLFYIKKRYCNQVNDYKNMHDGLVYDLHHQKFMGAINRIEGLVLLQKRENIMYNEALLNEVDELKKTFIYINDKYNELN